MAEKVNYHDTDDVAEGMHFLRDPLNCEHLGVTVLEAGPGWTGKPHDHADTDHEEVYLLLEGEAELDVEGETLELGAGDAVRVGPEEERQIRNGDAESRFVLAGAP
jgi:mannose-6-phosphate isomerase-like protein (cupin superfamily)